MNTIDRIRRLCEYYWPGMPIEIGSCGAYASNVLDLLDNEAGLDTKYCDRPCVCPVHINRMCDAERYVGDRVRLHEAYAFADGAVRRRPYYHWLGAEGEVLAGL